MSNRIYRYRVLRQLTHSAGNEVFEGYDPVLDRPVRIYRWTPEPAALSSSLAQLDERVSGVQELGAEVLSEAGSICLVTRDEGAALRVLEMLRGHGLFAGDWPGLVTETAPPPQPAIARRANRAASRSLVVIGVIVAIAFALGLYSVVGARGVRVPAQASSPPIEPTRVEPSFNCAKARTADELLICRDNRLAELDNRMVAAYRQALTNLTPEARRTFERAHLQWFVEYSRTCNSSPDDNQRSACIANYLREHTSALQGGR